MPNFQFALYETYLSRILGSEGSHTYRRTWCHVDGVLTDVTRDGEVSCSVYVSSILALFSEFGLIQKVHASVSSTVADMLSSGWQAIPELVPGAVILWEKQIQASGEHDHLGFYIGDGKAISHRDTTKAPLVHDADYASEGGRKIEQIFWHSKLGNWQERLATDTIKTLNK